MENRNTHHRNGSEVRFFSRGFTLSEAIIVAFLIAILSVVVLNSIQNSIDQARVAGCLMELRGIQAAMWHDSDGGQIVVNPETFWDKNYNGAKPGPYVLFVEGGDSAGSGSGDQLEKSSFMVVGRYDHWPSGQYVVIEGNEPPRVVHVGEDEAGVGFQFDWEFEKARGGGNGPAIDSPTDLSWAGSQSTGTFSGSGSSGSGGRTNRGAGNLGTSSGSRTSTTGGRTSSSRVGD